MHARLRIPLALLALLGAAPAAHADVNLSPLFTEHMVLQRGKPVPVFGTAEAKEKVTVSFGGQRLSATADAQGNWQVMLPAMAANTRPQQLTIAGNNTVTIDDVLVGDVWLCSGQSNMDMSLAGCDRPQDVESADFPGIRSFRVPLTAAGEPMKTLKGSPKWSVCTPSAAGGFSATAFYFARKIHKETNGEIPIGLLTSSVGGTSIDLWLAQEGLIDIPTLHPVLSQPALPGGPFHLANGMIYPLAPYGIKGAIWYQGENAEKSVQSPDSYFLKMKALQQGWKRLWGMDEFPFYFVMIANWGEKPKDATPVLNSGGWNADTRLQQVMAMSLPHAGCASALDIGDSSMGDKIWDGWHPKDKLDVGERLALWALKNDYGKKNLVVSGPVLKFAEVSGSSVVCSFDYTGSGLMVGSREWYKPTQPTPEAALKHFVIAGADGVWHPAKAAIREDKVVVSSPQVTKPVKVSYACWQNPEGVNLFNKEGLPAAPFHVEDLTKHYTITAEAGSGGEISPAGTSKLLARMTALYTIKPKPGYFVKDVMVDGESVGSVENYTFDPVYANHTIEATFTKTRPVYAVNTSANSGGKVYPRGQVSISVGYSSREKLPAAPKPFAVAQGAALSFAVAPAEGLRTSSLKIDGVSIAPRDSFSFSDVRKDHSIEASFACSVSASAGYGGTVSPSGEMAVKYGDNLTFEIKPIKGYSVASVIVDGKDVGAKDSYTLENVTSSHTIAVKFKGGPAGAGSIPQKDNLILACLAESLPDEPGGYWPTLYPESVKMKPISSSETVKIDGRKYSRNIFLDGDGFTFKSYTEPIACSGASIVTVARPIRSPGSSGWFSIVDVFYDRLTLGIRSDSGLICVRRNGPIENSEVAIPDGQVTILSMIVQPDGKYKVYANGEEVMASSASSPMNALVPGEAGFAKSITIGRNAPDAWTTFNGDIGDVFLYKTALTDGERQELEAYIKNKLSAE